MFSSIKIAMILVMLAGAGGAYWYVQKLQKDNAVLKENQINSHPSVYVKKIGYVSKETFKIKIQDKNICNIRVEELTEKFNNSISGHF